MTLPLIAFLVAAIIPIFFGRIRAAHEGKLNGLTPGVRMRGTGAAASQTRALFHACCKRNKLSGSPPSLSLDSFRRLTPGQGELF